MIPPYRADHVGSLLRPPELLEVKARFADGKATETELRAAEDAAVLKALEVQKTAAIELRDDIDRRLRPVAQQRADARYPRSSEAWLGPW